MNYLNFTLWRLEDDRQEDGRGPQIDKVQFNTDEGFSPIDGDTLND